MKLIDLLVKELPKRGGWPKCAVKIHQDHDGETWAWLNHGSIERLFTLDQVATNARKFAQDETRENMVTRDQYEAALAASEGWIQWAGDFAWSHTGSDGDIIAYRLQQPGIDSRANDDLLGQDLNECIGQDVDMPEWNGEGLPPVGIKCEHCPGGTTQHEWEVVTVAGVHENTSTGFTDYWLVRENGSSYIVGNPYRFRPLRTEAEKASSAAIGAMERAWEEVMNKPAQNFEIIYDAIAAGKIPGVKLESK